MGTTAVAVALTPEATRRWRGAMPPVPASRREPSSSVDHSIVVMVRAGASLRAEARRQRADAALGPPFVEVETRAGHAAGTLPLYRWFWDRAAAELVAVLVDPS
jgi:hypothetical protein